MKTYKVAYKCMIKPLFKLTDPYNTYAFPMQEFIGFGTANEEVTVEVKAPNKQIAKSLLACEIMTKHLGAGDDAHPIIVQALQNIVSIEEVHEDGRE
ncbi:hypothetical protein [Bacillus paralicheniformis]|uniref:hypothetical protein n=1 Tax=Bacillus paralicheniformis TaxID=1648923 RepID=UPI0022439BEB|nr:hypothetical protein [Bacillus paralicheniformis]MEC1023551.1 hypothetical protein [Bacillus paralicheniformis]MEC1027419.1 hypothetical protein [Bacillus paralicheniformis]MEC1034383.1 hypothetical protein [Bacillus paralicheniformis]MEC1050235.1 hypothetical protein [Bacillus paralicheniformis]MEC1059828.1 hypothetical protein [Bacillus paralicheniformis]